MATGKGEEPVAAAAAAVTEKEGEAAAVEKAQAAEAGKQKEESGRMIKLTSNDGLPFEVTEASARMSNTISNMIDDGSADSSIPLPNVDSVTLEKVIEYCDEHGNNKSGTDEEKQKLKKWDETLIDELDKDKDAAFEVIMAANYLDIQGLLDLTCQSVADTITDTIKGKSANEIREAFNIEDDLTEQDKEEIRKENERAFEKYRQP